MSIAVIELTLLVEAFQDVAACKAFCQVVDRNYRLPSSRVLTGKRDAPGSMLWPYCAAMINLPDDIKNLKSKLMSARLQRRLFEDAGCKPNGRDYYEKDGQQVTSPTPVCDGTINKNRAAAIQKMCKDAGINLTLGIFTHLLEFSDVLTLVLGMSAFLVGLVPQLWPTTVVSLWFESDPTWSAGLCRDRDEMFAKVVSTKDFDERMKHMVEAEKKMMQTYAYLPVYTGPDCYVVKKGLATWPITFLSVPSTIVGWQKQARRACLPQSSLRKILNFSQ